jgi:hypothetical protein
MKQDEIRIEKIKIKELIPFASHYIEEANQDTMIPISMQRAVAHSHNPFADGEDIGLLVVYHGDELVGYLGMMPIMLKDGDALHKIYFFSTWLASSQLRDKSIGSLLMKTALSFNQDYLAISNLRARQVMRKLFSFWEHEPIEYFELDFAWMRRLNPIVALLRLFRKLLHPFGGKVEITNSLTRGLDHILGNLTKGVFIRLLLLNYKILLHEISYNEVSEVREETAEQWANLPAVTPYRGAKVVNWMLKYPWQVEPGRSRTEHLNYYFTDVRKIFQQIALEITSLDGKEYKGYIVFSVSSIRSDIVLKLLDIRLANRKDERFVLPLVLKYGQMFHVDRIELPKEQAEMLQDGILKKVLLLRRFCITQCHPKDEQSPLAKAWPEIRLNYYDGDMAFS